MRAFRSFAFVALLWIGGRAMILVENGDEHPEVIAAASPLIEPRIPKPEQPVVPMPAHSTVVWLKPAKPALPMRPVVIASNSVMRPADGNDPMAVGTSAQADNVENQSLTAQRLNPQIFASDVRAPVPQQADQISNRRTAVSAYLFIRGSNRQPGLSGNALLGGSQFAVFVVGPQVAEVGGFAISPFARLTADPKQGAPQELALGVNAEKRVAGFVYGASFERRTSIDAGGRNAFAARATIGIYSRIDRTPLTLSGYGQAGIVGLNRRDGFAESEVVVAATDGERFRRAKPGIGLWAAIQPGARRIDVGPTLDIPIIRGAIPVTVRTSWRFRVGGNASPGSGPALILATGF